MIKISALAFTYEGDDTYSFSPDKKFRSFSTYTISITLKTRKIYSISAKGEVYSYPTCEKEQALIMAIIKKKYGEIVKDKLSSLQIIMQGDSSVSTECKGLFKEALNESILDSSRPLVPDAALPPTSL